MPKQHGEMTFDKALKGFVTATTNSKRYAQLCANIALDHFIKHGDLVHCQSFVDAIDKVGKNYVRKAAYLKWLVNFAPVVMTAGKLTKDVSETAIKPNYEMASVTPFWEFAPDMEVVEFEAADIVRALQSVIKRFKNAERTKPHDDLAARILAQAEGAVNTVQVPVNADLHVNTPPKPDNDPAGNGHSLDDLASKAA